MHMAYIGMGANLPSPAGPPERTLAAAAACFASFGRIAALSSLYSTEPVGYCDQPEFVNAVVAVETNLDSRELLDRLLAIELAFGRDRSSGIPNGPRTLDLDILLMGDLKVSEVGLEIPHPRLADRAFVLIPLNEVAPLAIVPLHNKTVAQLLHDLLESSIGETHAVVQIQSEGWRAGTGRGDCSASVD